MKKLLIAGAALIAMAPSTAPEAQERAEQRRRVEPQIARTLTMLSGAPDRAMIGVSTGTSGKRDTLGLLVTDVVPAGPAARAGIEEGDRLQSVNGVNLRLAEADAGEADMEGVALRRLTRELSRLKAGDEAEVGVYREGQARTVRIRTVRADELEPRRVVAGSGARNDDEKATLGVGFGAIGSKRDTSGVLIASVVDDGPADRARIEEGDRITSINGVDLRVAREDAGDHAASRSRITRLMRELDRLKPGDEVELRLTRGGQARTARVTTIARKDLPRSSGGMFYFDSRDGGGMGPSIMLPGFSFERDGQGRALLRKMQPGVGVDDLSFHLGPGENLRLRLGPALEQRLNEAQSRIRQQLPIRIRARIV
ncbi:MAG: PDZ domain-containing protein [Gemmatimonadota bacterium]